MEYMEKYFASDWSNKQSNQHWSLRKAWKILLFTASYSCWLEGKIADLESFHTNVQAQWRMRRYSGIWH